MLHHDLQYLSNKLLNPSYLLKVSLHGITEIRILADTYIHLSNQIANQKDETSSGDEQKSIIDLINRCKHMLNIFEMEYESRPDQYLEMNGNSKFGELETTLCGKGLF